VVVIVITRQDKNNFHSRVISLIKTEFDYIKTMDFSRLINHADLDITRVRAGRPLDTKAGSAADAQFFGRRVYLQYDHPQWGLMPLQIKCPKQKLNFGASLYTSTDGKKTYTASASFDKDSDHLLQFFKDLHTLTVDLMEKNYNTWFVVKKGAKVPIRAILESNCTPALRVGTNKETDEDYPPMIKYTFLQETDKLTNMPKLKCNTFVSKTQPLVVDLVDPTKSIPAGSYVETVINCSLFAGAGASKVYSRFDAVMMKVSPPKTQTLGYSDAFSDDEEDTDAPAEGQTVVSMDEFSD
jgi:hypothetical protein